jgi:hypothetical protein
MLTVYLMFLFVSCKSDKLFCYTLRNIGISVSKIDFVIRSVLSMVDIDIDSLPSKSTAAKITSELGLVARQQYT